MTAYTESEKFLQDRRAAVDRYNREKMDTITVRVPKGKKKEYYEAAEKAGIPFRQYFMQAIEEKSGKLISVDKLKKELIRAMDAVVDKDGDMLISDHLLIGADYEDLCRFIDGLAEE